MRLPWVRLDEEKERDSLEVDYVEGKLREVMRELRVTLEAAAKEIDEINRSANKKGTS